MDKHRIEPSGSSEDAPIPLEPRDESVPTVRARPIAPVIPGAGVKKAPEGPRCSHCGYSVAGLRSAKCPECGKDWMAGALARSRREEAVRGMRREYLIAIGLLVGGLAAYAASVAIMEDISLLPWYLLSYLFVVPLGILGFYICSWIWIGFDAPFMLTALRLTAIYAIADAADVLLDPIPVVGFFGPLVIYVGLLAKLLDLELMDAVIVAVMTFLISLMIGIMVFALLA